MTFPGKLTMTTHTNQYIRLFQILFFTQEFTNIINFLAAWSAHTQQGVHLPLALHQQKNWPNSSLFFTCPVYVCIDFWVMGLIDQWSDFG